MRPLRQIINGMILSVPLALAWCAHATSTATITVDANHVIGPVNPLVFGHNVEAADSFAIHSPNHAYGAIRADGLWDPTKNVLAPEMLEMSKEIGTTMMRYPGGCLVNNFNWHDAVGPIANRPNFPFGVDEFIEYCRAVGAEPLMTVSEYVGTPQDSADLVEYLNAPADAQHPWAQKRAQWGHPKPYGVRYFEIGNESDHGNHSAIPRKLFTGKTYAEWFLTVATLMRKVDPTIKIGAVTSTGMDTDDSWNTTVVKMTKDQADFIVVHLYSVNCNEEAAKTLSADSLMQGCMAAGEQYEMRMSLYREMIKRCSGKNIPLAVTEFNASFVQNKPIPYRFSFGSALFSADLIRVMLKPTSHVMMANYWQLANGYWGMIKGYTPPYRKMPAYYLFRLWAQHFGKNLVAIHTDSPRIAFDGACRVRPASGDTYLPSRSLGANLLDLNAIKNVSGEGYTTELHPDGVLVAKLNHMSKEDYPEFAVIKAPATGTKYQLSFEARATGNLKASILGLELCDSRGWSTTNSAIAVEGMQSSTEWTAFGKVFVTLPDCPGISLIWRLRADKDHPVDGTIEVRNLKVTAYDFGKFPAYATITSSASLSQDGKTLYLIIFNKHLTEDTRVHIALKGLPGVTSVRRWMVTGPSLASLNLDKEEVREVESGVDMPLPQAGVLSYTAPARSMTAIEIRRK
ncbi:MAG TPA: alpha-L-arabinofuranosidase C-terminal domain-containing protein [Armatimonadota bacterium]|nr:alpha-L-arabinofuranosidase C-terminal domain-containing protein [Armatimonadota bacterium]